MQVPNLWGDLPDVSNLRTPATILKEQGSVLHELTGGLLYGEVKVAQTPSANFVLEFRIVAPALGGYRYELLEVRHGVTMYPLRVIPAWKDLKEAITCASEVDFQETLANILQSDEVRNVIASLLAQSNK